MKNLIIGLILVVLIGSSAIFAIESEIKNDAKAVAVQKHQKKGITTEKQLKAVFNNKKKTEIQKIAAYENAVENGVIPRSKHFQRAEAAYEESMKMKHQN